MHHLQIAKSCANARALVAKRRAAMSVFSLQAKAERIAPELAKHWEEKAQPCLSLTRTVLVCGHAKRQAAIPLMSHDL